MSREAISLAEHIRWAWPGAAGKTIARLTGCTVGRGHCIAHTGMVPRKWRAWVVRKIDEALERNERELARLRAELRREHDGAADPAPGMVGAGAAGGAAAGGRTPA